MALGLNRILIQDRVENLGVAESPLILLYYINLGSPFLNETSALLTESHPVEARDAISQTGMFDWMRFQKPTPSYVERVCSHTLPADQDGWAGVRLINRARKLGLSVRFEKATLPELVQWKMMAHSKYVLGLEPADCRSVSVAAARRARVARCNSCIRANNANFK